MSDSQNRLLAKDGSPGQGGVTPNDIEVQLEQQTMSGVPIVEGADIVVQPAAKTPAGGYATYGMGPVWGTRKDFEATIRVATEGPSSATPVTVPALFARAVQQGGSKPALSVERPGEGGAMEWTTWSWIEYGREANAAAAAFQKLGVEQFGSVTIWGFNSPEWMLSAVGAMLCGAKAAGIYPTDTPEQVQYKTRHSGAAVMVVEDNAKLAKLAPLVDDLPDLKAIVVWGEQPNRDVQRKDGSALRVLAWKDMLASGGDLAQPAMRPGHCCALIYTSGTTGNPKAVMVSHDNIVIEARSVLGYCRGVGSGGPERILSYLPLSHVAGMMVDILAPVFMTAMMPGDAAVYFARPDDLKAGTIGERLRYVKPTMFLGVPRVWEKIRDRMKETAKASPPSPRTQGRIDGAKERGAAWARSMQLGGTGERPGGCLDRFVDGKVYEKVRERLGLDCCKFAITGAAPIDVSCLEFFGQLGININELYGMSECTGATTVCNHRAHVWGSCGFAMAGAEVKIFRAAADGSCAADRRKEEAAEYGSFAELVASGATVPEGCQGEVCFRGRHVMMGYMANPDLGAEHCEQIRRKTEEAIDAEGWLHSGDKGAMDRHGMVRITGRFKEIIIPAGGENVSPIPVEEAVKQDPEVADLVSNVMLVGDKRKYCVALVSLKVNGATGQEPGGDDLTKGAADAVRRAGGAATTVPAAMDDPKVADVIARAITRVNRDPKAVPNSAASVKSFTIIPADFSESGGQLTATLKLKRSVVEAEHASMVGSRDVLDGADPGMTGALYAGPLASAAGADCYARYR